MDKTNQHIEKVRERVLLTQEELSQCALSEEEVEELEEQAKIGLAPHDDIGYKQNFQWLFQHRLQEKTAKAQLAKALSDPDILIKDPDQSLPQYRNPNYMILGDKGRTDWEHKLHMLTTCQQNMIQAHWVRVIKGE